MWRLSLGYMSKWDANEEKKSIFMPEQQSLNNKRIAKNAILLYCRMLVTIIIGVYVSRVVLRQLGIVDFGIYEVVAGVVSMFGFITGTLMSGTQRFLTFALGEGDMGKMKVTFSTMLNIHFIMSVFIGLLVLVWGIYLIANKLVIPSDRLDAAYWILYSTTLIVVLNISQVPYMASIIAHEDMKVYAYMSILESVLKLSVAFALCLESIDKLKMYAILMATVQIIIMLAYRMYCKKKYEECELSRRIEWKIAKEIGVFSGWNIFGNIACVLNNQGLSILLNSFYGPVMNTAQGLSNKLSALTNSFVVNFQQAVNPQIVKYYAINEKERMLSLICNNSRLSGLIVLLILVPMYAELSFVLDLWLGKGHYPLETIFFTKIVLMQTLINSMTRSLVMGIFATGKLKTANLTAGIVLMLILPVTYILLTIGIPLKYAMIVTLIPWFVETLIESTLLHKYIGLPVVKFYRMTYLVVFSIGTIMLLSVSAICFFMEDGWLRFMVVVIISTTIGSLLTYRFGMTMGMRDMIKSKIRSMLQIQ